MYRLVPDPILVQRLRIYLTEAQYHAWLAKQGNTASEAQVVDEELVKKFEQAKKEIDLTFDIAKSSAIQNTGSSMTSARVRLWMNDVNAQSATTETSGADIYGFPDKFLGSPVDTQSSKSSSSLFETALGHIDARIWRTVRPYDGPKNATLVPLPTNENLTEFPLVQYGYSLGEYQRCRNSPSKPDHVLVVDALTSIDQDLENEHEPYYSESQPFNKAYTDEASYFTTLSNSVNGSCLTISIDCVSTEKEHPRVYQTVIYENYYDDSTFSDIKKKFRVQFDKFRLIKSSWKSKNRSVSFGFWPFP